MRTIRTLGIVAAVFANTPAAAWDPIGDITHPDRIIRNIERETGNAVRDIPNVPRNVERELGNVGREVDRMRLEAMVQAGAPGFEQWLQGSRNSAASGGTFPYLPIFAHSLKDSIRRIP